MNSSNRFTIALVAALSALLSACTKNDAVPGPTRKEADAKVQAEAARNEMEKLPTTFKSRYNKKLAPDAAKAPAEAETKPVSQTKE